MLLLVLMTALAASPAAAQPVLDPDNGFAPPWQKTLLIIGQDKPTIDHYVYATQITPGGVMVYTSIQELSGRWKPFNNGAGIHDAPYLMKKYPNSTLQLGLYMVDALLQINDGTYDKNIDALADWIALQDRPVFLRIGYEFDEPSNHYDTTQYIYAFQRIVNRIRAKGVSNVVFVWHSAGKLIEKDVEMWYPGDEYVDWIGVSFFSTSQYETATDMYWKAYFKEKNFMIAEASPMGMISIRAKKDWYQKFFEFIEETKPQAVCYINTYWDALPAYKKSRYGDARVEKIPEILEMWMAEIQKEPYIHAKDLVESGEE
ncbi:MAG: hypothetical protein K8I00_12600 [Candidatus Omnitrophica bacterium]|nr:hypothetical protein [Candidatus Omnitrophota bacterium]